MRIISRLLLILFFCTSLLLLNAPKAFACLCLPEPPSVLTNLARSSAVFVGTVTQIHEPFGLNANGDYWAPVSLQVSKIWKGPSNSTLVVSNLPTCGYPFEIGKTYLVFAHGRDNVLYTTTCNRIRPLDLAAADIEQLDTTIPSRPNPGYAETAVVTVRGRSQYPTMADLMDVRFVFAELQPADAPNEIQRKRLMERLVANGAPTTFLTQELYGDRSAIYFSIHQTQIPNNDTASFFKALRQTQIDLAHDEQIAISKVEVLFRLQDCMQNVVNAQREALANAQLSAELLANIMGGKAGAIVSLTDESTPATLPKGEFLQCGVIRASQWYELPMAIDPDRARVLDTQVALQVTFRLEKAVSGLQPALEELQTLPPTPTPTFTPIPSPTPTVTPTPTPPFVPTPFAVSPLPTPTSRRSP